MGQSMIFFDIDGTLTDRNFEVPASAATAVRKAVAAGHLCVVNTGRPYLHVVPAVKELPFTAYVCSCGMHLLGHGKTLVHESLTVEQSRIAVQAARECRMEVIYESEEGMFFDKTLPMREYIRNSMNRFGEMGVPVNGSIDAPDFYADKFSAWARPESNKDRFLSLVSPFVTPIERGGSLIECVKTGFSKKTGMDYFMNRYGIAPENTYAIGDSLNDLVMLTNVAHPIAMGNAAEEVKEVCEYVTADLREDGLYAALEHYNLLDSGRKVVV